MNPLYATNINQLSNILSDYKDGYISYRTGRDIKKGSYTTLSPEEVIKHKKGSCFDMNMIADYVIKQNFPDLDYSLYYIESNDGNKMHSWLLYKDNASRYRGMFIVPRSSSYQLYYDSMAYKTFNEVLSIVISKLSIPKGSGYVVFRYKQPSTYHLNKQEFRSYIFRTGALIRDIGGYYKKNHRFLAIK